MNNTIYDKFKKLFHIHRHYVGLKAYLYELDVFGAVNEGIANLEDRHTKEVQCLKDTVAGLLVCSKDTDAWIEKQRFEILELKTENEKLRTALKTLEESLHSSELEAMTAWSLLEEANKKMEDDQSLPTTATDKAMCPKCGTSHTAKQVLEFSTEWFPGTHTIACRQCREDFSITCVPATVISPPREVKL